MDDIKMSGFLHKRGEKSKIGGASWQKRYFELKGKELSYYVSQSGSELKGKIDLTTVVEILHDDEILNKTLKNQGCRGFKIAVPGRTYEIYASSEEDFAKWLIELNFFNPKIGVKIEENINVTNQQENEKDRDVQLNEKEKYENEILLLKKNSLVCKKNRINKSSLKKINMKSRCNVSKHN